MNRCTPTSSSTPNLSAAEPLSAPFLFWGLVLLGMAGLAPAILLPQWRAYERLQIAEQIEAHRFRQMQDAVTAERRMLDGLRTDPALVARVAQRDLSVRPEDAEIVPVDLPLAAAAGAAQPFVPEPVAAPALAQRYLRYLPALDYDAVFCEPPTRTLVIVMSVGLICVALLLYGRSRPQRPACPAT